MGAEHEVESPQPAAPAAPAATLSPHAVGGAQALLSLQRRAGNQAVLGLMRQKAPPKERKVSIDIVVERAMTPHEFAVRAFMQAFRMPGGLAEQRVTAIEAQGSPAGTGPNFDHGVRADEVGKKAEAQLPAAGVERGRAGGCEGPRRPARRAAAGGALLDRRGGRPPLLAADRQGQGHEAERDELADALNRDLWMRTRDSVGATATGSRRCRPARGRCSSRATRR